MKITLGNYGEMLISRPAGREAALAALAYVDGLRAARSVTIDFTGVKVLSPSWMSEFVQTLEAEGLKSFLFSPSDNSSVSATLKILEEMN